MKIRWIEERQGLWALAGVIIATIGVVVAIFQFSGEKRSKPGVAKNIPHSVTHQEQVSNNQETSSATHSGTIRKQKNTDVDSVSNVMQDSPKESKNKVMRWGDKWGKGVLAR